MRRLRQVLDPVAESTPNSDMPAPEHPLRAVRVGLSGKLLLLTIVFVMVAEILIYVPSIANVRLNWLNDRLAAAHTAALVLDAAPSGMVPESLAKQILDSIGARAVALKMGDQRRLLAAANLPSKIEADIDMTPELLARAWCDMNDEQQADFFIRAALIMGQFPAVSKKGTPIQAPHAARKRAIRGVAS